MKPLCRVKQSSSRLWMLSMFAGCLAIALAPQMALAGATDLGGIADNVIGTLSSVAKLITAAAYIGGLGFAVGAILKFKQHKDNPTQIPIGTPIALLFVAAALIFLPTILGVTGSTLFGTGASVGGVSGVIFSG